MITKSNTLIEAGFDLTVAEHNLMTLAINKLHKQGTGVKKSLLQLKSLPLLMG